jgi:hypothetical protein
MSRPHLHLVPWSAEDINGAVEQHIADVANAAKLRAECQRNLSDMCARIKLMGACHPQYAEAVRKRDRMRELLRDVETKGLAS